MKVLILTPWFPRRPGEQFAEYIYAAALALKHAGTKVRVLVTRPWAPPLLRSTDAHEPLCAGAFAADFPVLAVQHLSLPGNRLRSIANRLYLRAVAPEVRRIYQEWRFDVVHAHMEMAAAAALAADLSVPVLTTIHGLNTEPRLYAPRQLAFVSRALRGSARVILVGDPLREHFTRIAGTASNFRVIYNGFTWPAELSANRKIAFQRPLRILSVSNLHEGKGVELNLRALAALKAKGVRDWRYTIIGGGYLMRDLRALASKLDLDAQVTFTGPVRHSDIYAHLLQADVFLLPSYREAFGVAYLEAMAAGLYTVGIAGQGPAAFIRHRENGLLLPPRDAAAIESALEEIMRNPEPAERAARQGRKDVFSQFTWGRHAELLMEQYGQTRREFEETMRHRASAA